MLKKSFQFRNYCSSSSSSNHIELVHQQRTRFGQSAGVAHRTPFGRRVAHGLDTTYQRRQFASEERLTGLSGRLKCTINKFKGFCSCSVKLLREFRKNLHYSRPVFFNLGSAEPRGSAKIFLGSAT